VKMAFAVFGGLVAWTAHLLLGSVLAGVVCPPSLASGVTLHATTAGAVLIALAAAMVALQLARATSGWRAFLAWFGLLLDLLTLSTILLAGLTPIALRACA
jgi:hypothetical protein